MTSEPFIPLPPPEREADLDAPYSDEQCPDCGALWPETMRPCPTCGLSIEDVAERLARRRSIR